MTKIYYETLPISALKFGVHRPPSWWAKHPHAKQMLEKIRVSIRQEGMRNPLTVVKNSKGYVVEVGNQRLQALLDLKMHMAACIIVTNERLLCKEINVKDINNYFKDGVYPYKTLEAIAPADKDKWDGEFHG